MLRKVFLSENVMLGVVIANAIAIFLMAFPELEHNAILVIIDRFFLSVFVVEAIIKIHADGWRRYFSSPWNRFDFTIVAISVAELIGDLLLTLGSIGEAVILFRLFRLIRLLRFIRFVPNMLHILAGLARAFKASVFVLIALVFMNFMLAVFTTYLYSDTLPEYFGNPLKGSFTIFQMFTLEGWSEIPATLAERHKSPSVIFFAYVYFMFIVLSGGIFGMSLANAIFVDEMTVDNNKQLEDKIEELQLNIAELKQLITDKKG